MTSPLLERPGAVEAEGFDAGVAAHYSEPLKEQRALVAGDACVDLSHWGLLRLSGPDALTWLDSLTSGLLNTETLSQGAVETLVLDPQGHVEHAAFVVQYEDALWLLVDPADTNNLYIWLNSMRFMLDVTIDNVTADYAVVGWVGTSTPAWLDQALIAVDDPWPGIVEGGTTYAQVAPQDHPGAEHRFHYAIVQQDLLTQLETSWAGLWAWEALRIAAWRPRIGCEVPDDRTLPHELDWLRTAVHLDKGCYRGQETVAKVFNLGRPPRRLVFCDLDGSLPAAGAPVTLADKQVGVITSRAMHYELGPIALALIKRTVDPQEDLQADGIGAKQTIITAPSGEAVDRPTISLPGRGVPPPTGRDMLR